MISPLCVTLCALSIPLWLRSLLNHRGARRFSQRFTEALIIISCFATAGFSQSADQRETVLLKIAAREYHPTFSAVAAKLLTNVDTAIAYAQLDTLLDKEYGDMFWMTGCAGLYFSCKDKLPEQYQTKIRDCWKHFTPYRGDTDNHFLMYYGSLLLFAEEWESLPASEWFMGRSSEEIRAESKQWIEYWLHETMKYGQSEFDSPRYLYYYITPLLLLSEYSTDTVIATDCSTMLTLMLAEYASLYTGNSYAGAHSRQSNDAALSGASAECTAYGEYFFEDSVTHILPDLAFAAVTHYEASPIIVSMAHERKKPYENFQIERTRRRIRNEKPAIKPVRKYTYVTNAYSLGSIEGGIVNPIQQQSWSLVLNSRQRYNTITGLHPYYSATELGTFFPEEPSFMLEKIEGVKTGYISADKFVGGSPYETIWQRKNQIHCSYAIPEDAQHHHVDIFIPAWGNIIECDSTVWHQVTMLFGKVQILLNTETDFSLIPMQGGYRLRLKLDSGRTSYWFVAKRIGALNEDRDPFMFSGDGVYKSRETKWRIRSPFLNLKYGSTTFKITDGINEETYTLSPKKRK
jgi:hypothetical protein